MISVTIKTASGHKITATLDGPRGRVTISQDGHHAGEGRWTGSMIDNCGARLGAPDGSETEDAYDALDAAIKKASRKDS